MKQDKSAREATLHKILVNISVFCLPALTDCFISFTYNKHNASSVRQNTLVLKTQYENKSYACLLSNVCSLASQGNLSCFIDKHTTIIHE